MKEPAAANPRESAKSPSPVRKSFHPRPGRTAPTRPARGRGLPAGADSRKGFTLLEVMVSLTIGLILLGGLMGLISVSLHYGQRLRHKSEVQPVLEAAAQTILAFPEKAGEGTLVMESFPDKPAVEIQLARVFEKDETTPPTLGELYRVQLYYQGQMIEFSILVPTPPTQ